MSRTYFAEVETGKRNISIENIDRIAQGLDVYKRQFIAHITGTVLTFLLTLCICSLVAYSSALNSRADDGGVLGDAHVKTCLLYTSRCV